MSDLLQKWASEKAKRAGVGSDAWAYAKEIIRANKAPLIGAAVGGVLGAGEGYLTSKRWKGQPSLLERRAEKVRDQIEFEDEVRRQRGQSSTFSQKLRRDIAHGRVALSKTFSEHPVAAAATLGAFGAELGSSFGSIYDSYKHW